MQALPGFITVPSISQNCCYNLWPLNAVVQWGAATGKRCHSARKCLSWHRLCTWVGGGGKHVLSHLSDLGAHREPHEHSSVFTVLSLTSFPWRVGEFPPWHQLCGWWIVMNTLHSPLTEGRVSSPGPGLRASTSCHSQIPGRDLVSIIQSNL